MPSVSSWLASHDSINFSMDVVSDVHSNVNCPSPDDSTSASHGPRLRRERCFDFGVKGELQEFESQLGEVRMTSSKYEYSLHGRFFISNVSYGLVIRSVASSSLRNEIRFNKALLKNGDL